MTLVSKTTQYKFASLEIASEIKKAFGSEAKTVSVEIRHRKAVGQFVQKIEKAHQQAAKSKLVFG